MGAIYEGKKNENFPQVEIGIKASLFTFFSFPWWIKEGREENQRYLEVSHHKL